MEVCIVCIILEKFKLNVKSVNVVTQIFDRLVWKVCLEILRCCSGAISMKVSDLIIYIMKIMWRDFKTIRSSRFRDIPQYIPGYIRILFGFPRKKWIPFINMSDMYVSSCILINCLPPYIMKWIGLLMSVTLLQ